MNFEELKNFLLTHNWALYCGAGKMSKSLRVTEEDFRKARNVVRDALKEQNLYKSQEAVYGRRHKQIEPKKKVLIFDIETAPLQAYVWGRWNQDIHLEQTISEGFVICWSAKWLFSDTIMTGCLTPEEILNEDDSRITEELWKLFDEADIVVAYNGSKFDIPLMNSRFLIHGLNPPSAYFTVDPLITAKHVFRFSSNKLDALATYFGIANKLETGFDLWKRCMQGDREALDYMARYNRMDVDILEQVYLRLRPYIKNHPNISNLLEKTCCGKCGCEELELIPNKYYYTQISKFPLYRCKNCGSIVRGRKNLNNKVNTLNIAR